MHKSCAFIVIDSGFSQESMAGADVLAAWDLCSKRKFENENASLTQKQVAEFAGDPMGHGSIVLERLLARRKDAQVILVKAFAGRTVCRTKWRDGKISEPGWTEGYTWAAELAQSRGMVSVCNCSFGSFSHAMDGTGWEAHQLGRFTGAGKAGHVLVAAAGFGDARPVRGSFKLLPGLSKTFLADQDGDCEYNFWFGLGQPPTEPGWALKAHLNGELVYAASSKQVPVNMWNGRQQLKFQIWGAGLASIEVCQEEGESSDEGLKVDVWSEAARFRNWVSTELVGEPACFPSVLGVGLRASSYSPYQEMEGMKPDLLLPGSDQISFRLPEVVDLCASILEANPDYDVEQLRKRLGKYPL